MRLRHLTGAIAASVLPALLLAGCADSPDRAQTIGGSGSGTSTAASSSSQAKPARAGDELTAAQAKKALLDVSDMPTGWSPVPASPSSSSSSSSASSSGTIKPASCQKLFDEMDNDSGPEAKVSQEVSFTSGGALGSQLTETVSSFEAGDQQDKVGRLADLLTSCPTITTVDSGEKTKLTLTGLSFPNLGDQTLAFRAASTVQGIDVTLDAVFVATDHNVVSITVGGLKSVDGAELEKIVRAGVAKVAAVAEG